MKGALEDYAVVSFDAYRVAEKIWHNLFVRKP